jgi:hypothetical protein
MPTHTQRERERETEQRKGHFKEEREKGNINLFTTPFFNNL